MAHLEVTIETRAQQRLDGLWCKASDKTISRDIKALSGQYHRVVAIPEGEVLPYFVLSRNYDEKSRDFELFIGSEIEKEGLEGFLLPAGAYARLTVRPKLGFLWGVAIGEAKRYFYTEWLPQSPYRALDLEYEYHTEKSTGKQPTVDILFAIQRK